MLQDALIYLAAAVIAVPLFKRLGLGAVLGYLVAGILIGYEPRQIDKQAEEGDFRRVLSAFEQLLMIPKFWILQPFLDKSEITGRYIQNVCVAPAHRGKGTGSGLIRHFCSMSQDTVWLDVEMGNKENRAIYEHLGFRVVREIPIFLPGLGSIRMIRQS